MYETLKQNKELWDLYTRKEEYSPKQLDQHNRFAYVFSNYKNISEPKVSKFFIENGLTIEYPENKKFAICLTHDVDDIYPPLSHMILSSLYCMKNFNFDELKNQFLWKNKGKEFSPYWNFKEIIKLEDKYNAKSSFYFLATDRDIKRFRYNIEDLEHELDYIISNGCEVGLHGGYYAYNELENIKQEKRRLEKVLGKKVIGYRNHYLRFKVPDTWELLSKADFKYDTTLGYDNVIGFRNGMCYPFKPFNLESNKEIDIIELPLILMDVALLSSMKDCGKMWETIKELIDIAKKNNGVLTILWHNNEFNCPFRKKLFKLYTKILDYSVKKDAWITSGEEIWRWWQNAY